MIIPTTNIAYIIQHLNKLKKKASNTLLADAAAAYFSDITRLIPANDKELTKIHIEKLLQRIAENYAEYTKLEDTEKYAIEKSLQLAKTSFLVYGLMAAYGSMKKVWQHGQKGRKSNPLYVEMQCPAGAKIYQFCGVDADPTNCVIASKLATEAIQFCTNNQPSVFRLKNEISNRIDSDIALSVIISEFSKIQRFELSEFDEFRKELQAYVFERDYKYVQQYDFHSKKNIVLMVSLCVGDIHNFGETYRWRDEVYNRVFVAPYSNYIDCLKNYQPFIF